jgi:hypothetical protein
VERVFDGHRPNLEAAKIRREPKRALSEQNERGLFLERVDKISGVMRR